MSTIAATAQAADRIDYWIRHHLFHQCHVAHRSESAKKFKAAWDRSIVLSAIGQSLKKQCEVTSSMPGHLARLVQQLETQS
jgi:hypothetical protein